MNTQPKITIIKPKAKSEAAKTSPKKIKVAAYARVSTEMDEQQNSYEAQVSFYENYIKSNKNWQFIAVFADRGITGTSTKNRTSFNKMVKIALMGGIDLILTKTISRFARNTVDTLQTVRKHKDSDVEVFFEKENLHTLDPKCEMLLTIMSSLAQEESRSISENIRWGKRKSMQDGRVSLPYSCFLGYRKGVDGKLEIVESEAKIVRKIYTLYLKGRSMSFIAKYLTAHRIPTPRKKKIWTSATVKNILTNEKYKGDALLQKTYIEDYLTKKRKKNTGELPQYYVKNSHPAIIPSEVFDEIQRRLIK